MLADIIGQEKLKNFFKKELEHGNLSYGYILEGDKFMGKSYIARNIADEITIPIYINEVLPGEDRKLLQVEDIRALREDAYSQTFSNQKKVYIIPNADAMTVSAQNAFLKVLEEPPQECVFILLAVNRQNLLETIRSRCTLVVLSRYSDKEISEYLQSLNMVPDNEVIRLCNGTLNKYLFLSSDDFKQVKELAFKIVVHIMDLHKARIFAIFKHIKKVDSYVSDILDIFLIWYRDIYVYKLLGNEMYIEFETMSQDIIKLSKLYTEKQLLTILDQINLARLKLQYNCNLEMTINTLLLYMRNEVE